MYRIGNSLKEADLYLNCKQCEALPCAMTEGGHTNVCGEGVRGTACCSSAGAGA
jgi:hypothetical protein